MFNILSNIYLQASQAQHAFDVSILAIIISSITMTIFAITLVITLKTTKQTTNSMYAQLLKGFHEEITSRLNKNAVLKTTEDCERYANDYLNTLDEIAYLTLNDKISSGIAEYFKRFFSYGITIIEWYNSMIGQDFVEIAKKNWPNHFEFCKKNGIQKNPDDKLPKIMQDYNKLKEKEEKN